MYSAELPLNLMLAISDVLALESALKFRVAAVYPHLQKAKAAKYGRPLTRDELKAEAAADLSRLSKKSRRLQRTLKGFVAVAEKFNGPPKGLEAVGLDRLKQATEEIKRLKVDYASLIEEFDEMVRQSARPLKLGRP